MGCIVGFSHQSQPFLSFSMLIKLGVGWSGRGWEGVPEGDSFILPVHPMVFYTPGLREMLLISWQELQKTMTAHARVIMSLSQYAPLGTSSRTSMHRCYVGCCKEIKKYNAYRLETLLKSHYSCNNQYSPTILSSMLFPSGTQGEK